METDNPREIFPTGKNPDYGGKKKRYPPHGKIVPENSQAVNRATPFVRPERCGLAWERKWQQDAGSIYGEKTRPQAVNQAQHRWRRCLPTGKILGVCTSRESGKGPGTAFFTKRWMRRWGTRATPTGPCVAQGDRRGSGRWLELGWCCSLRSDQFDDGLPGVEGGDDCFKG